MNSLSLSRWQTAFQRRLEAMELALSRSFSLSVWKGDDASCYVQGEGEGYTDSNEKRMRFETNDLLRSF